MNHNRDDYRNTPGNLTPGKPEYNYQDLTVLTFVELKARGHEMAHYAANGKHACLYRSQCTADPKTTCHSVARLLDEARNEWRNRPARQAKDTRRIVLTDDGAADWEIISGQCPSCPSCPSTRIQIQDSVNWGNIIAQCPACFTGWNHAPVDHRGILAEARRGF